MDLQAVRATASEIARAAGAVLMEKFEKPHQETREEKRNRHRNGGRFGLGSGGHSAFIKSLS